MLSEIRKSNFSSKRHCFIYFFFNFKIKTRLQKCTIYLRQNNLFFSGEIYFYGKNVQKRFKTNLIFMTQFLMHDINYKYPEQQKIDYFKELLS